MRVSPDGDVQWTLPCLAAALGGLPMDRVLPPGASWRVPVSYAGVGGVFVRPVAPAAATSSGTAASPLVLLPATAETSCREAAGERYTVRLSSSAPPSMEAEQQQQQQQFSLALAAVQAQAQGGRHYSLAGTAFAPPPASRQVTAAPSASTAARAAAGGQCQWVPDPAFGWSVFEGVGRLACLTRPDAVAAAEPLLHFTAGSTLASGAMDTAAIVAALRLGRGHAAASADAGSSGGGEAVLRGAALPAAVPLQAPSACLDVQALTRWAALRVAAAIVASSPHPNLQLLPGVLRLEPHDRAAPDGRFPLAAVAVCPHDAALSTAEAEARAAVNGVGGGRVAALEAGARAFAAFEMSGAVRLLETHHALEELKRVWQPQQQPHGGGATEPASARALVDLTADILARSAAVEVGEGTGGGDKPPSTPARSTAVEGRCRAPSGTSQSLTLPPLPPPSRPLPTPPPPPLPFPPPRSSVSCCGRRQN